MTGLPPDAPPSDEGAARSGRSALLVGAGILLSRIFGLVRQKVIAHYFGLGLEYDAFTQALRIPNLLQNLFGEGALSASFIPVYSRLLAEGEEEEAGRVAGAVFAVLALVTTLLVVAGVLAAPLLVDLLAPGFEGQRRALTITLVRIFFPGVGVLVLSAWCLGILNSHRRFLLSYSAPVIWNVAIIAVLVAAGNRVSLPRLAEIAAWGAVAGSVLQFAVQLPSVLRLVRGLRLWLGRGSAPVRTVLRNFLPALASRGVAQIGAFVDLTVASLLPLGAAGALFSAQNIYMLPVSLFGMSISAAALPEMARVRGDAAAIGAALRTQLETAMRRVAFFVIPSAAAFIAFGDLIAGLLLQGGRFERADSVYVWGILAGSAVGLLAATLARLFSSTFYALRDTRTPLHYAAARIALAIALGVPAALYLPEAIGLAPRWGAALLTLSSGIAGWVEFALLRRALGPRTGTPRLGAPMLARLWLAALLGVAAGWGVKLALGVEQAMLSAIAVLGVFGLVYLGATLALGVGEAGALVARVRRRR